MSRLGLSFAIALVFLAAIPQDSAAQVRIVSRFGEANVGNERVLVHVTVAVPPGADANAVAEDALRGQGARPFQPQEFSLTGLLWPQFFNGDADEVTLYYNSNGEEGASSGGTPLQSFLNSQTTWGDVGESRFGFAYGGTTGRCPSLVRECPGPQVYDGTNDVAWLNIKGCCTLGVTWFGTSSNGPETDMALNTGFSWTTDAAAASNSNNVFDVQTVFLHELGHVLGLGHTPVVGAVMEATYAGVRRELQIDDERGVTYLYPEAGFTGSISGTVSSQGGGTISGALVSIADFPVSTTTAADGTFSLDGVPKIGSYSVTASAENHDSQTLDAVVDANLSFLLNPSSGDGDDSGGGECVPKGPFGNNCK